MGTVILGTGACVPRKELTNFDLEKIVDTSDEWIRTRTGIESRRIGGEGEKTYQLASAAASGALEMSGVKAEDIDLLVVGTISSHMMMPSCACFVQNELGAKNAFAYDINAACCGFLYGLDIADKHIRADHEKKVLVIGAETLSSRLNWEDRNTCILFGDGAGAAVLGYSDDGNRKMLGTNHCSDGGLWICSICITHPARTLILWLRTILVPISSWRAGRSSSMRSKPWKMRSAACLRKRGLLSTISTG